MLFAVGAYREPEKNDIYKVKQRWLLLTDGYWYQIDARTECEYDSYWENGDLIAVHFDDSGNLFLQRVLCEDYFK